MKKKSLKKEKDKSEIINKFKKTWLVKGINTLILIAIIFLVFLLINFGVRKWSPTPIDLTKSQDYSLTEESKNRVKNVEKDVTIYFAGIQESSKSYQLVKQYSKVNSKIKVEKIDVTKDLELTKKYNLTSDVASIVVESGKKSRTLTEYDMITYDENYNSVDVTEQKVTSAILNVTAEKTPKIYFLTGYTKFALNEDGGLSLFAEYLNNEVLTYENLNILNTGKVPDDCDTLVIMTPEKDFNDMTANQIIKYIKKGGNILWLNGVYTEDNNFKNVNKVLAEYGVKPFEKGVIYETDTKNIMLGYPTCFMPEVQDSEILKDVKSSMGTIFLNATKININEKKLESLNVDMTELITSGETTYFTKNLKSEFNQKEDQKGSFTLGAELVKTIKDAEKDKDAVTSTLVIYGNDFFISDQVVSDNSGNQFVMLYLMNNADVPLNTIAILTNNDQDITIRKSYSDSQVTFTPSERAKKIIALIIFAVPILIIIAGIVVWNLRKRRK